MDRALAAVLEPRRRVILRLLAERPRTVGDLASGFEVSRPAISQHLAVLREAGLVAAEVAGGRRTYRVLDAGVRAGREALRQVVADLPGDDEAVPDAPQPGAVALAVPVVMSAAGAFRHFTEPGLLTRWLGERAQLDPRPGGRFRVELGGGDVALGAFEHVEAPGRVAFTWGAEAAPGELGPGSSRVAVAVAATDAGTVVRLVHHGLPGWARGAHLATWARQLATFAALEER